MMKFSTGDLWKVIKKYILILICIPLLTTGAVYVAEKVILPNEYTASTQLLMTMDGQDEQQAQTFDDLRTSIQLIGTFSTTIQSERIKKEVAKELNIKEVTESFNVVTDENSLYFTVNVTGKNPKETIAVTNALGDVLTKEFPKLFKGIHVNVMESADSVAGKSISFQLMLGFITGLMASIILAISLLLFSSIVTKDEQLRDLGLIVLGDVPWKSLKTEEFENYEKK